MRSDSPRNTLNYTEAMAQKLSVNFRVFRGQISVVFRLYVSFAFCAVKSVPGLAPRRFLRPTDYCPTVHSLLFAPCLGG